jgi:TPR repeat protein
MKQRLGENLSREWNADPHAPELWDSLQLIKSEPAAGLQMLSQLAEDGSSLAMMYLGEVYLHGRYDIGRDERLGEYWLRRSAEGGSLEGAFGLAWHLLNSGKSSEAFAEYRRLSELKYSPAQFALGWQYCSGIVVERDLVKALAYFRLAEEQGHLQAANQICRILMRPEMGPVSWLRGLIKKIALAIPFIKLAVNYPSSDRLRT